MGERTTKQPRPDRRLRRDGQREGQVEAALERERAELARLNVAGCWQEAADRYANLEQRATPEVVKLLLEVALANRMLSGGHYNTAEQQLTAARALATGLDSELEVLAIVGLGDLYRSAAKKNNKFHPELDRHGKLEVAWDLRRQAEEALRSLPEGSLARVKAQCEFGLLNIEENNIEDAINDYRAALAAAKKLVEDQPESVIARSQLCRANTLIGEAYEKGEDADAAFTHHEQAYQGYEKISDKRGMALGQQGMALALEGKSDIAGAITHWQAVERIANNGQEVDTYMADKAVQALARLESKTVKV